MKRQLIFILGISLGTALANSQTMDWLCHPGEYSQIQYLGSDLFKVKNKEGRSGIIQADGNVKIAVNYDSITPFVENRALLLDKDGRRIFGIVDNSGSIIKDFSGEEIYVSRYPHFKEGRLAYGNKEGLYGYLNDKGATVIEPKYYLASPFQNGVAAVQYENPKEYEFGLINKAGSSILVSNERYKFISNPIDGKVLVIKGSRKGADQLALMRIDGTSLKKEKVLEDGMNIWLSDDFSSVECQLGHTYNIDNQWRVVSSSHDAKLPQPAAEPARVVVESSTVLSKVASEGGMKITYLGNPIMDYAFPDVSTYDKSYAVVRSKDGKVGVLKLNPSAAITIKSPENPVILNHNDLKDVILDVELVDVDPTKIKWYRNNQGWLTHSTLEQVEGQWKLRMPYFKASDTFDTEDSDMVDIAITYDGLDWMHQFVNVKSVHQPGYKVTLTGSDTTDKNGHTTLTLHITSISGNKNPNGTITVNNGNPIAFSGGAKSIPLSVTVSEGQSKTFIYSVVVSEEGCPSFTTTLSKGVSNPKREEKTKISKKDRIIK